MLKLAGIVLVLAGASGTGISMAIGVRRTVTLVEQLLASLEQMKNEISYRKTPLPELMRLLAVTSRGTVSAFFSRLADDLYSRQEPSVAAMMRRQVAASQFPPPVRQILVQLGNGLGQFDVQGQLRAIDLSIVRLKSLSEQYREGQSARIRSYCTLGVCAGLAIAILAV